MRRLKHGTQAEERGSYTAFALCSTMLLLGAVAGCVSGARAGSSLGLELGAAAEKAFRANLMQYLPLAGVLWLLCSSCIGFLLFPPVMGAAGFVSGYAMAASLAACGSWMDAFRRCGWLIFLALPLITVLGIAAMRISASLFRLIAFGVRPEDNLLIAYLRMLLAGAGAALFLAALQTLAV